MIKYRILKLPLLLIFIFPQYIWGQEGSIGPAVAEDHIKNLYRDLSSYAADAYEHKGDDKKYTKTKDKVLNYFYDTNAINLDVKAIDNGDSTEEVNIKSYLNELNKIASKQIIRFLPGFNGFIEEKDGVNFYSCSLLVYPSEEKKYYYKCKARIGFKGKEICSINYSEFDIRPEEKPLLFHPNLNIAFGYKFNNCLNFSIGLDGLSDRWFLDHLRFDVEFNYMYNQEHPHYSTATDGTPSQLTYISENGDFGIGMNIGYRIIPDKYGDLNWGPTWLSVSIGFGGVFYDKWWEYNGTSEGEAHGRSAALYIKPSLCLEYLITDHFGMGIEAGYYFCPKYDPMQGLGLKVVTKFAL